MNILKKKKSASYLKYLWSYWLRRMCLLKCIKGLVSQNPSAVQSLIKITPLIFDFYFAKVPILPFLVIHFIELCWNKMFSASLLSQGCIFFFIGFLSRTFYFTVSTYFQISFKNFLRNKQTNKNRWKKIIHELQYLFKL